MSEKFFQDLVEFLPKHVSPRISYAHALVAFLITGTITYIIGGNINFDFNDDGEQSEIEKRTSSSVRIAGSVIISLLVADFVFSTSWKLRNLKTNKNHITYSRWFPGFYSQNRA